MNKLIKEYEEQHAILKDVLDKGNDLFDELNKLEDGMGKEHETKKRSQINIRPYLNRKCAILEELNKIIEEKNKLHINLTSIVQAIADSQDMSEEEKQSTSTKSMKLVLRLAFFDDQQQLLDEIIDEFLNANKGGK